MRYTVEVLSNFTKWFKEGTKILHREDGPAIEYHANGDKFWYLNGSRHRVDGPAIEYANGYKAWYVSDFLHREDGPAVQWPNGNVEWWLNGKRFSCSSQEEFIKMIKPSSCDGKIVEIDGKKYKLSEI